MLSQDQRRLMRIRLGLPCHGRCLREMGLRTPVSLSLQLSERRFDLATRLCRSRTQRQAGRPAIVTIKIHGVLEARNSVLGGNQHGSAGDAVLPIECGVVLAGAMCFPNGYCRVRG